MSTSSQQYLRQQFTVNTVDYQSDTATRVNIKKRKEIIMHKTLSSRNNINIAYIIGQGITPSNNLFISDRGISLTQNRISSISDYTIDTTSVIYLNSDRFLVTDVFSTETPTKPEIPLFFSHTFKYFNSSLTNFSDLTLISVDFTDYTLKPIKFSEYQLDTDTGKVYNNIENSYNDKDGSISITMVKYTVRDASSGSQTINIYHELIDNQPIYELASLGDLDETSSLVPGTKKYLSQETLSSLYKISLPQSARYAYKELPSSRIKVKNPTTLDISSPWNVRISNGKFITALETAENTYTNYKYYIAEFNSQSFNPYPPYTFLAEQQAIWIYNNILYLSKNIAYNEGNRLHINIIVRDSNNELKFAFSTDSEKIGTIYEGSTYYTDGILSVDSRYGFIEVSETLRIDDKVKVSYYTEEDEYLFTSVDFNPANNLNILNHRTVIYTNPEVVGGRTLEQSIYYLTVDSLGRITYASQPVVDYGSINAATLKMQEDFNSDGSPNHTFYYDQESTASGLNSTTHDDFSFIDKYTVESVLLSYSSIPDGVAGTNYTNNPRFLVLADIYVGEAQSPESLSKFDIREQGGGIKEEYFSNALALQPEASWYWDFRDDRPYPSAGVFVADIPQTLLTDHGGSFTRDQVVSVVERHMKAGGYAVIRSYGIDPAITSVTTTSSGLTVGWPTYGSNASYNVYYSTAIDKNFSQANSSLIVDSSSGNEVTVTGLNISTKYFVKIGAVDQNSDESFSTVVSATTLTAVE